MRRGQERHALPMIDHRDSSCLSPFFDFRCALRVWARLWRLQSFQLLRLGDSMDGSPILYAHIMTNPVLSTRSGFRKKGSSERGHFRFFLQFLSAFPLLISFFPFSLLSSRCLPFARFPPNVFVHVKMTGRQGWGDPLCETPRHGVSRTLGGGLCCSVVWDIESERGRLFSENGRVVHCRNVGAGDLCPNNETRLVGLRWQGAFHLD